MDDETGFSINDFFNRLFVAKKLSKSIKRNPESEQSDQVNSLTHTSRTQIQETETEPDSMYGLEDLRTYIETCYDPEKLRAQLSKAEKLKKEMLSAVHDMFAHL